MSNIRLFDGIEQESLDAMMSCFKPEQRSFRRGETILVYSQELEYLCVLVSGRAHLYCMDSDGDYAVLEHYEAGDVFGEVFTMPNSSLGYAVEADAECAVMFIRFSCIYGRCSRACAHHSRLTRNLFELSARKAQVLALRINMISKRSTRRKLMSYFEYLREREGGAAFDIGVSLSQLAGFLFIDRSSMMRELKRMSDDGLILRKGRKIELLYKEVPTWQKKDFQV